MNTSDNTDQILTPEQQQKMTERQQRMEARNVAICDTYMAGKSLAEIGKQFKLKRQRIKQIVQQAGLWRERNGSQSDRDVFLGINISETDKSALRAEAARLGISMSAMTADWIRERLNALKKGDDNGEKRPEV